MITASLLGEVNIKTSASSNNALSFFALQVVCANAVDRDHCSEPAALIDPPTMKDVNIWQ